MQVLTRSYDNARTGANRQETFLTPKKVAGNAMVKLFSMHFDDDPRLEAQPLYVPAMPMSDGQTHDVLYVCTMANNVWAFDANTGAVIWKTSLGPAVTPNGTEIDMFSINKKWGILSTPVIDLDTKRLYAVAWASPDGKVANAIHKLHEVDIASGHETRPAIQIGASAPGQVAAGKPAPTFVSSRQKQRSSLLLVAPNNDGSGIARKTLFMACGMTHEEGDPTHGWVIAFDLEGFRSTAAWCTTPNGHGGGIWQAGQGPAADKNGDLYLMTGNYGVEDAAGNAVRPAAGDLPESIVKLHYTAPADAAGAGKLEAVAFFTPFHDADRNKRGEDNFQDYDLGSGGPILLSDLGLVVGAGKDGVLYVLDQKTAALGQGSDFSKLKQPPIFFTYFPGFGIDPTRVQNLDNLFDGKTHHLHGSPAHWVSPANGAMLFCWGENESLRAWKIDATGKTTFFAKSAEVASAGMGGRGGMPGGFPVVTSNGATPNTGIIWSTAPISGDANKHVVEGILRAYDATALDPNRNADGTPRLKLLWDSKHIPGNTFNHNKFCPPVVADGKVFVPTYDGRVDVYGLVIKPAGPVPTNANGV